MDFDQRYFVNWFETRILFRFRLKKLACKGPVSDPPSLSCFHPKDALSVMSPSLNLPQLTYLASCSYAYSQTQRREGGHQKPVSFTDFLKPSFTPHKYLCKTHIFQAPKTLYSKLKTGGRELPFAGYWKIF